MQKMKEILKSKTVQTIRRELAMRASGAKAILFGSRARGDFQQDSDWDILILLDKQVLDDSDYDNIAYPLYELGWKIDQMISPKLYTLNDWMKRSFTPFYKNIEEEGIAL